MSQRRPDSPHRSLLAAAALWLLPLAVGQIAAAPAGAQAAAVPAGTKTADPLPPGRGADLFQPMGTFDLTPEQQRALDALRGDPSSGAIQVYRVNLNVPKTADAINFNLVPGSTMMLATRSRADRSPNDYSWSGGDAAGDKSASLVVKDRQVTGTLRDGAKLYRVRSLGGGATAVIEVDQKKLPPEHPPAFDRKEKEQPKGKAAAALALRASRPQATVATAARSSRADAPGAGTTTTDAGAADATTTGDACGTIDVLVAYTQAAESQSGAIDGLIQLAVDETNNSYSKSGIQPRMRLVRTLRTSYVESGDMEVDVARLAAPADGFLDDIPPQRDAAGADVVVLVTGNGNFCGIARDILADVNGAYAVVGQNCATGYYSFAHEVGHLQGARHNPEADDTAIPFAYGHGFFSLANRKRTVMSYDCPLGCTRIDAWATPQVVVEGVAMGDALLHNDARVLNETACAVAAFRAAANPVAGGTGVGTTQPTQPAQPTQPTGPAPHPAPALSAWSLLLLLGAAPFVLARRARA